MLKEIATRTTAMLFAAAMGALQSAGASAGEYSLCGQVPAAGSFGPFDYRIATEHDKKLVEGTHFTPDVANLRSGETGAVGADIAYTLGVFPNHPRALLAMSKLGQRTRMAKPPGARLSVDCYFDRAVRWKPDDPNVRLVFGIHLISRGQKEAARPQLDIADKSEIEQGGFRYNLGLAFLDIGDAERALAQAWRAYAAGYDLPGLRNRLEKMGKWRDPEK